MLRLGESLLRRRSALRGPLGFERGQSLVETAFGFVILIFIISGVIDIGRMYFSYVALEDGAGEAALYLAINPRCLYSTDNPDGLSTTTECADPNNGLARAQYADAFGLVDWSDVDPQMQCLYGLDHPTMPGERKTDGCDSAQVGDIVEVRLNYHFDLLAPIIPEIAGAPSITLTTHATQPVLIPQYY